MKFDKNKHQRQLFEGMMPLNFYDKAQMKVIGLNFKFFRWIPEYLPKVHHLIILYFHTLFL